MEVIPYTRVACCMQIFFYARTSIHAMNMDEPCYRSNASHLGNNMTENDNEKGKDDHIFDLDSTSDKHLLDFTKTLLSHKGRTKDVGAMIHATLERTLLRVVSALNADSSAFEKEETSGSDGGKGSDSKSIREKNSLFLDDCFLILKEVTSPSSVFNVRHGQIVTVDEEHGKSDMLSNSSDDDSSGDEIIEIDPAWRSKIGFADWVDFLDEKKSTWSRAQIVEENQPEFKFKILREGELDYHAEWVEYSVIELHLITRKLGLLRKSYENFRSGSRLAMNWMQELTLIALGILGLLLSSGPTIKMLMK